MDGAHPGDVLKVHPRALRPQRVGMDRPHPRVRPPGRRVHRTGARVSGTTTPRPPPPSSAPVARVPLRPFAGTLGVAPAEPGLHSVVPPGHVGGNMDVRDLHAGTTVLLPGGGGGGAALGGGHPRRPGRRRGLRHRPRVGDDGGPAGGGRARPPPPAPLLVTPATEPTGGAELDCRHGGALVTTGVGPDLMTGAPTPFGS